MAEKRRDTKTVLVGNVPLGGGRPVAVQSMTNTPTHDVEATLRQIRALEEAGCEIVRCAVPDERAARALPEVIREARIPVVADIHFRADLAVRAVEAGAAKVRINPGNLPRKDLARVLRAARAAGVPVRIGVNSGSLDGEILRTYGSPTPEALVESMMRFILLCEKEGFEDLVLSIKSTSVAHTVEANRLLAARTHYPIHIGITEAGTFLYGTVKSAAGLGILLYEGIGDTVRVSLSGDPVREIEVARYILQALRVRRFGPEVITCPTCGRTRVDVERIAREVEEKTRSLATPLTIAVMGCEVNGPGEAREADIGVACGTRTAVLFVRGKEVRKIPVEAVTGELVAEINARFGGGAGG